MEDQPVVAGPRLWVNPHQSHAFSKYFDPRNKSYNVFTWGLEMR